MGFSVSPEHLMPDLSTRQEMVVLARALWREGWNDHLAGHITVALDDGTLLCTPWLLTWEEFTSADILRIDRDGGVIEGEWPVPPGIPLHLELHKMRSDVTWAVHNHPLYATIWADIAECPPVLDQSSALGGGALVLVNEYRGPVNDPASARRAIEEMGSAHLALLAGHGAFVVGGSARAVHQRGVALEQRCQRSYMARAIGGGAHSLLPESFRSAMVASDGEGFVGFWEAAVRVELRADPALLD